LKFKTRSFKFLFKNLISILSRFGFWGKSFVLASIHAWGGRREGLGHRVSWSRRRNGSSEKERWATVKKREKEEREQNEKKIKRREKEREKSLIGNFQTWKIMGRKIKGSSMKLG
jgi:hypothetical protein